MNAAQDQLFRNNLKGIICNLFCTHEQLPEQLSVLEIVNIFQNSVVAKDRLSGNYFISFNLTNNPHFDLVLRFMRDSFFNVKVSGVNLFICQDYNPYDRIQYFAINQSACLLYLMNLL